MTALNVVVLVIALLMPNTQGRSSSMKADVDRLVQAAERLTGDWPSQPPPAVREVGLVAQYGRDVVPLLTALLSDDSSVERLRDIVPWSLGEIGDRRAVEPLLQGLAQDDLSMRLLAISALEKLNAQEALPRLRELSGDERKAHPNDPFTIAQAARHAIATISQSQ